MGVFRIFTPFSWEFPGVFGRLFQQVEHGTGKLWSNLGKICKNRKFFVILQPMRHLTPM
jgi:hypothetical protein